MCHSNRWARIESFSTRFLRPNDLVSDGRTNLSAPSMHTNLAFLFGRALRIKSAMATPVKSEVETPAAPHENPLLFRTWFCSFLRLPAQTKVMGQVICSYSAESWRRLKVIGLSTSLPNFSQELGFDRRILAYPSMVNCQSGMSASLTSGTAPWFRT